MLTRANILKYLGTLSQLGEASGGYGLAYVNAAINVLKRFDKVIINMPSDADEIDRTFSILTALKRIAPNTKVYGWTSKDSGDALIVWTNKEIALHDTFGELLDGIYIANFDATDTGDYTGFNDGTFTRTDQNLAIIGVHNHGYEVFAESTYPELTLGPALSTGETASTLGTHATLQDGIMIKNYMSDEEDEQRGLIARAGVLDYVKGFAEQEDILLYTAVAYRSYDGFGYPSTYVPIDRWETIREEIDASGIDGFGVDIGNGVGTGLNWYYTNKNHSLNQFDPRASEDVIGSVENPPFYYCRLWGEVLPTVYGEEISPLTIKYRRTSDLIGTVLYLDKSGEVEVTPDDYGYWEVLIAGALTTGTSYSVSISGESCGKSVKKTKTLIGGTSVEF
jgi:hypothetical protein